MKNMYVGNLSFSATEQTVRSLFEPFGTVGRVNVVTDRDTGQPRGLAFVEMGNDDEAAKAMAALNGKDVDGKTLAVNEARPKKAGGSPRPNNRDRFSRDIPTRPDNRQILT
jgi:cold-inducible RNA-binding protein